MVSHVIVSHWLVHSRLTLSLTCIYGGGRVHYVGSTTDSSSDFSTLQVPFPSLWETIPWMPITIGINVTVMFHIFLCSFLLFFSSFYFFSVICWNGKIHEMSSSHFFLLTITRSSLLVSIKQSVTENNMITKIHGQGHTYYHMCLWYW